MHGKDCTWLLPLSATMKWGWTIFSLMLCPLLAKEHKDPVLSTPLTAQTSLFNSLDRKSLTQYLAFYALYPDSQEGKQALQHAWQLLTHHTHEEKSNPKPTEIQGILALVTRQPFDPPPQLTEEQLNLIDAIACRLHNRTLKGHRATTQEEIFQLPSDQIDLARGLLLCQSKSQDEIRHYEANLDLMALQIAARLPEQASCEEKIKEINRFIFQEMQFRFPPHSLYAKDIDLYTFLPSVLDSREGVCLGVSILYLALSQRLNLPLNIITPPGHIYVRYKDNTEIINIETTARGIDLPSETYLGINTRKLQERSLKEVIGLHFINQAAACWTKEDYASVVQLYEQALPFLPQDPLLKMLLGFNYLFIGKKKEGEALLRQIQSLTFEEAVSQETIPDDYLKGKVDIAGIKSAFLPVDETRESILKKQQELLAILKKYPNYRAGIFHLATTWLQLNRHNEAKAVLERYHRLDPHNATVTYYLTVLCLQRHDYPQAWQYLTITESLTQERHHYPKVLKTLRSYLRRLSPEPLSCQ